MDVIETLYSKLTSEQLMTFRTNLKVILKQTDSTADFNAFAEDFFVEMLNLEDTLGKDCKSEESWQNNSYLNECAILPASPHLRLS